jgi:hypothetical protein
MPVGKSNKMHVETEDSDMWCHKKKFRFWSSPDGNNEVIEDTDMWCQEKQKLRFWRSTDGNNGIPESRQVRFDEKETRRER